MHPFAMYRIIPSVLVAVLILLLQRSAVAQWTREEQVPATDIPSLLARADGFRVGTDERVFVSTDGGGTFTTGSAIPDGPAFVDALFLDGNTLFAGTGGNGLFVSPNEGITWQYFSQGLSGLGSNYITDVAVFDGDLWCATMGAGVFRRSGATWVNTAGLDPSTAGNVDFLKVVDGKLWAGAGGNGFLWRLDPGASTFTPAQVAPLGWDAFMITDLIRSGDELLLGSTYGAYRSSDGGQTWTPSSSGMVTGGLMRYLHAGGNLFALVNRVSSRLYRSWDQGVTWTLIDHMVPTYAMAAVEQRLYIGRTDGLWYRDDLLTAVPGSDPGVAFSVYPIPTAGPVTVQLVDQMPAACTLRAPDGRVASTWMITSGSIHMDLSGFAAGAYLLEVEQAGRRGIRRIVLQ